MKVGYVGLGAMGNALARRLVCAHQTFVSDLNPGAVEALVALGAHKAQGLRQMAQDCEIVFLCLPRSKDVEAVLFGSDGLAGALKGGSLIVDQTSGVPSHSARLAERLSSLGVGMIDAPVAGGVPAALAGAVAIMVSGADAHIATALPLLQVISPRVFRCGDRVGDAQAAKLVNNCINSGYRMATLELVALARKLGLSLPVLADLLSAGWGGNFIARRLLSALVEGKQSTDFALALMLKDVNQCLDIAGALGVPMPVSSLTRGLMQAGLNLLSPTAGLDEVVDAMERMAGAPIRDGVAPAAGAGAADDLAPRIAIVGGEELSANTLSALSAAHPVSCLAPDALERAPQADIVIDFTHRSPAEYQRLGAGLAARGAALVEVASGAEPCGLIDLPALWLCGGPASAFARVHPLLEAASGRALHCGPNGAARVAELVGSAVAVTNRAAVYENAWTGLAYGLEPERMATALNEGSGWSAEGARVLDAIVSGAATTRTPLGRIVDELDQLIQLALQVGAPLFIATAVRAAVQAQIVAGGRAATLDALAPQALRPAAP